MAAIFNLQLTLTLKSIHNSLNILCGFSWKFVDILFVSRDPIYIRHIECL